MILELQFWKQKHVQPDMESVKVQKLDLEA